MENLRRPASVERLTVISTKPFEDVVAALEAAVGHPSMSQFQNDINAAKTYKDMELLIRTVLGRSGFIQFARFDLGAILRKEGKQPAPKILRFLIGNPLVMKEMVKHVPDAGSYAPVTILIAEQPDGVRLSYDTMAGFLAPYGSSEASKVARDLDSKVETLLKEVAA